MAFCLASKVLRSSHLLASHLLARQLLAACSALVLAMPLAAQDVTQLHLKDGRVLVGKVKTKGDNYEVTTYDGSVTIAQSNVVKTFPRAKLLEKLRTKAKSCGDSAFAHLNLAKVSREYGLTKEMWRHLDKTIKKLS